MSFHINEYLIGKMIFECRSQILDAKEVQRTQMPIQAMLSKQKLSAYYAGLSLADQCLLIYLEGTLDRLASKHGLSATSDGETFCHHIGENLLRAQFVLTGYYANKSWDIVKEEILKIFKDAGFRCVTQKVIHDVYTINLALKRSDS